MRTSYSYADELFSDRRLTFKTVSLVNGTKVEKIHDISYTYTNSTGIYSKIAVPNLCRAIC